jgi:hypothetical protein
MFLRKLLPMSVSLATLVVSSMAAAQISTAAETSAASIKAHITFLASDLLEGRDTGTPGYDIAANYMASQFAQLGLKPAGTNGTYFQPVPLVAVRSRDEGRYVLKARDGTETPLVFGDDYMVARPFGPPERKVTASMVFVGFGVVAPERKRDDYRGLNVKGKIVVVLAGAPSGFQTEERAYYANGRTKREQAARRGAVGLITLYTPTDEKRRPFADGKRSWQQWAMNWRRPDGAPHDTAPDTPSLGSLSLQGAEKLFVGAKVPWAKVIEAAEKPQGETPRLELPGSLDVTVRTETKSIESANVAAIIEGSDPALKAEVVVLSAHLDHIGISSPLNGDTINNGALDNAAGIATTLEVARAFKESGKTPRRSVMFLAVTGEEKGLLGSEYFARNPTVPATSIAANVNLDMPILTYAFTDVIAFGSDRSTLGAAVARAAAKSGVGVSPDPLPEEGFFTRSDHFRFVEAGVPSIFLMTGFQGPGEAQFKGFLASCYHKPCDDLALPIDYVAGARFATLNYDIAREIADGDARPVWKKGDFFGGKFARPALVATD